MTRRFGIITAIAATLVVACAIAGWELAWPIARWKVSAYGDHVQLVFMSEREPAAIPVRFAFAFAFAPLAAWLAILLQRVRGRDSTRRAIAVYAAVAFGVLAVLVIAPALLLSQLASADSDIPPMIRALDLAPGANELTLGLLFAITMWLFAFFSAAPPRSRDGAGASRTPAP